MSSGHKVARPEVNFPRASSPGNQQKRGVRTSSSWRGPCSTLQGPRYKTKSVQKAHCLRLFLRNLYVPPLSHLFAS